MPNHFSSSLHESITECLCQEVRRKSAGGFNEPPDVSLVYLALSSCLYLHDFCISVVNTLLAAMSFSRPIGCLQF